MLRRLCLVVCGLSLGGIPLIAGLLAGWWGTFWWLPEPAIRALAISGLVAGLLADLLWLRRWVRQAPTFPWQVWLGIYTFYAVVTWGFCMGVPVAIVGLALPTGLLLGRALQDRATTHQTASGVVRKVQLATTGILALLCAASAVIALTDTSTGRNLELMLRLPFTVKLPHLVALIGTGGMTLLALNWMVVGASTRWSARRFGAA